MAPTNVLAFMYHLERLERNQVMNGTMNVVMNMMKNMMIIWQILDSMKESTTGTTILLLGLWIM